MRQTTVFIYLDGCRFDYINPTDSPFLFELGGKGIRKKVRATAGFTQRTAMLTGTYPSTSGHFTWYLYDPLNSPFAWLRPFAFSKRLTAYNPLVKRTIRTWTRILTGAVRPDPAYIPLDLLSYFDLSINRSPLEQELAHLPNVFSVCQKSGLRSLNEMDSFATIGSRPYTRLFTLLEKSLRANQAYDLYLAHLADLDLLGHKYGPDSGPVKEAVNQIDNGVAHLCDLLKTRYRSHNLLVVSDHGMRQVSGSINITADLARLESKAPEDYVYFLDSTMARFWFRSRRAREEVEEMLLCLGHGRTLSDEERRRLHVDFSDNRYGDILFWLDKGCVISPSFFQRSTGDLKGMHGYVDDDLMLGAFIVYSTNESLEGVDRQTLELVDTFPTLLDLLPVAEKPPSDGTSALEGRKA